MARSGRATRDSDTSGGGAARIASRRREARPERGPSAPVKKSASSAKTSSQKRGSGRGASNTSGGGSIKRGARLVLLIGAMLCIGFFAVLVIDVAATLVGKVHLGDVTVVDVWHKMVNRVLDRDVPRPLEPTLAPAPARPHATHAPIAQAPTTRAPIAAAPRPEDDARHVGKTTSEHLADPQVQQARQRLDDLLGRL